METTPKRE